jgi:hypothetical protein
MSLFGSYVKQFDFWWRTRLQSQYNPLKTVYKKALLGSTRTNWFELPSAVGLPGKILVRGAEMIKWNVREYRIRGLSGC